MTYKVGDICTMLPGSGYPLEEDGFTDVVIASNSDYIGLLNVSWVDCLGLPDWAKGKIYSIEPKYLTPNKRAIINQILSEL